jgi:acetoin utilization protein AcuB
MKIKDIMSYNVVTTPSDTSIAEAKRIMDAHHIAYLPVVDRNKLVGIVTARTIDKASPSKATSLSIWELSYLLDKTPVKQIMAKDVLTAEPEMDAEQVLAAAQKRRVGSAVVLEDGRVTGIVTTTDFIFKIVNPLLGIDAPGDRLEVAKSVQIGKGPGQLEKLMATIRKYGYKITTVHIEGDPMTEEAHDVCFHIFDGFDMDKLIQDFKDQGYAVRLRNR